MNNNCRLTNFEEACLFERVARPTQAERISGKGEKILLPLPGR